MLKKDIKNLIKTIKFTGITINIGFIGLNFTGAFPKKIFKEGVPLPT